MNVYAVMMDYSIKQMRFGCKEMYEARNVNQSLEEAEKWISANKPQEKKGEQ